MPPKKNTRGTRVPIVKSTPETPPRNKQPKRKSIWDSNEPLICEIKEQVEAELPNALKEHPYLGERISQKDSSSLSERNGESDKVETTTDKSLNNPSSSVTERDAEKKRLEKQKNRESAHKSSIREMLRKDLLVKKAVTSDKERAMYKERILVLDKELVTLVEQTCALKQKMAEQMKECAKRDFENRTRLSQAETLNRKQQRQVDALKHQLNMSQQLVETRTRENEMMERQSDTPPHTSLTVKTVAVQGSSAMSVEWPVVDGRVERPDSKPSEAYMNVEKEVGHPRNTHVEQELSASIDHPMYIEKAKGMSIGYDPQSPTWQREFPRSQDVYGPDENRDWMLANLLNDVDLPAGTKAEITPIKTSSSQSKSEPDACSGPNSLSIELGTEESPDSVLVSNVDPDTPGMTQKVVQRRRL